MARWEPDAQARLQNAALELVARQGFERTTAAEIAEAVGLNRRTFFRHFPDKRDVFFAGQDRIEADLVAGVTEAPPGESPMGLVGLALARAADTFARLPREQVRARQAIIDAEPALQERERQKFAALARSVGDAMRERGVAALAATLAAESGVLVFRTAFTQWLTDGESRSLPLIIAETAAALRALNVAP
ncbi:TetR family transcriptional regulator [Actinacidiphila sp. DG2A-62]|uniref:TetR family transcriptional regulator n=1 Tax=Actinacidiphila sp. DG2A-62 TaxID=3108821 RepID=UPI002DC046B8|nr:TetR family transcriptional regulator [Actinacidiphila sp. DG2A-62]MEC3993950.1 TetR family transcriptional regulator [Actinacidiphila sp. DG2A-62]